MQYHQSTRVVTELAASLHPLPAAVVDPSTGLVSLPRHAPYTEVFDTRLRFHGFASQHQQQPRERQSADGDRNKVAESPDPARVRRWACLRCDRFMRDRITCQLSLFHGCRVLSLTTPPPPLARMRGEGHNCTHTLRAPPPPP
jgi:hypothetical protein